MVQLFNSAASQQILAVPGDADLFEGYYKAYLGILAAAGDV